MNWKTFKCKSGAEYQWKHDDRCLAIKVGESTIWLELAALQFFEAELFMTTLKKKEGGGR